MNRPALPVLISALLTALVACSSVPDQPQGALAIAPAAPEVQPGDSVQFTATAEAAVEWAVVEPGGGTIDTNGHYTAPATEGTFTVTAATASDRRSTPVHVKRNVSPPVIASFTATPETVAPGGSTTLAWSVTGATAVTIDPVGPVSGGTQVAAPSSTTTYTLTATNRGGSVTAQVTVNVDANVAVQQGTGTSYGPSYLTSVTGGGAMPDWSSNVVTASCAGDGQTDDTACLQAAANAARDQRKPLVIPATSAFYRINGPFTVYGSVAGVGGTPTIKQSSTSGAYPMQKMITLARGMTGWVYNLHLVGTFDGSNPITEQGHQIDVGTVDGVTIKDNLLESAMGDAVSTDVSASDGGTVSQNVLVDGNTIRNPYRCAVAFIYNQQNWVITNNVIDKQVNYVSGIDIEPEHGGVVNHVEIAYNQFVMNNRTANPSRGADGMTVFGWHVPDPPTPTAGGDYYLHHNYGTFGTGFSGFGNGGWGYIYQASNVEGSTVPQ